MIHQLLDKPKGFPFVLVECPTSQPNLFALMDFQPRLRTRDILDDDRTCAYECPFTIVTASMTDRAPIDAPDNHTLLPNHWPFTLSVGIYSSWCHLLVLRWPDKDPSPISAGHRFVRDSALSCLILFLRWATLFNINCRFSASIVIGARLLCHHR